MEHLRQSSFFWPILWLLHVWTTACVAAKSEYSGSVAYRNPILPGFHPDPSCTLVQEWDNTFFCATSSFNAFPAVPIFASKDLRNFRQIGNVITKPSQLPGLADTNGSTSGIWAPSIRYHNGTFWVVTTLVFDNRYDTCPYWDDQGNSYIVGSHYWRIFEMIQGGTGLNHMVTYARSHEMWGPYESDPANPVLSNANTTQYFQTVGHADIFQDTQGNWWAVALSTRSGPEYTYFPMGRETILTTAQWDKGEFPTFTPVRGAETGPLPPVNKHIGGDGYWVGSDDDIQFSPGSSLPMHFIYNRFPDSSAYTISPPEDPNTLRLTPSVLNLTGIDGRTSPFPQTFVGRRQEHILFKFQTTLRFESSHDQAEAGVTIFLNQLQHFDLGIIRLTPKSALEAGYIDTPLNATARYVRLTTVTANSTNDGASDTYSRPAILPLDLEPHRPVPIQIEAVNRTTYAFKYKDVSGWKVVGWGNSSQVSGGFTGTIVAQAVISRGYVSVSRNIGCTKDFKIVPGGVQAQTRVALENVSKVLQAAGSGLEHVVKATVFLKNMPQDFQPMNEVYKEFFQKDQMPAPALAARLVPSFASSFPAVVPAVHNFAASSSLDSFELPPHLSIVVDKHVASRFDCDGMTLISPTLLAFAHTFASDVQELFPDVKADVSEGTVDSKANVFLSISSEDQTVNFTLAKDVKISGSGARGVFWGTRTLLQGLLLNERKLPSGVVEDRPDWETRGFMLDVGRQWYPISFLTDLCSYASWFKTSEFVRHVHLSDNLGVGDTAYARFRLRPTSPNFDGLTPHLNETYSREEFADFQSRCAARGVTVIPEIESPGHALVITQWKPELALLGDPTLINLTVPDAIPTIKSIWKEQVSIGADEYSSTLANEYNNFVDEMVFPVDREFFEDDPYELIRSGYNVINSDDAFQYIVMKYSGSYPQRLNQTRLWDGANVNTAGIWDPHIFDRGIISDFLAVDHAPYLTLEEPLLQGAIMAIWNDHGTTASTFLEAFYALKEGLPVIISASWQAASRPRHLTQDQFDSSYPALEAAAPGQNLDRRVPSKGNTVVAYDFVHGTSDVVTDKSGNGYDGMLLGGFVSTPLGSKGHNYTLLIELDSSYTPSTLLSGPDDSFGFTASGNGTTLSFTTSNITFPLFNFTFPAHAPSSRRQIVITGTELFTSAFVDGAHVGDFLTYIDETAVTASMSFVAPVQHIAIGEGSVSRLVLWNGIQDIATVSAERW
ncbi:hypothetical protein EW146_g5966 [Bondarzewia mesenterica]|uniref:beta-N-acetylhexosaminidase n=1 Tax=Bondarzewia mesenterica TaxID=1095465 RepID=A0A4S4LPW2_9AGAM|nr:hypothetical protein EW146_g5966 [Bondarzewia mesenterica]